MPKNIFLPLIILFQLFSSINSTLDCTLMKIDTTCSSDPQCDNFVVNSAQTACVNCYIQSAGKCGQIVDQVCAGFVASSTTCIIDCTQRQGVNPNYSCPTDLICTNYVYSSDQEKCIDCTINNSDQVCSNYILNYEKTGYVDCTTKSNGKCNSDYVCADFVSSKIPGQQNVCVDCKVTNTPDMTSNGADQCVSCADVSQNKCANSDIFRCSDYRQTENSCYDCSALNGINCKNASLSGCVEYAYSSSHLKCVDCTTATNVDCVFKSVPGCVDYRFDGTNTCLNCSFLNQAKTDCLQNNNPICSDFSLQTGGTKCIDCSLIEPISKECININNSFGCKDYTYSKVYDYCVNCAAVSNGQCINSSVDGCYHYKYDSISQKCVDCSASSVTSCVNDTTSVCVGYQYSLVSQKCVNCSNVKNGSCLNGSDPLCFNFKFDGYDTCQDCSNTKANDCTNKNLQGCVNFRYDTQQCYDCSLVKNGSCLYSSLVGCSDFQYDGYSKCYDCSISNKNACINQFIAGCANYRHDGISKCVDCSKVDISNSECANTSISGCAVFKFDEETLTCFDCYDDSVIWTNKKCYACFKQVNIISAQTDATGCKSPYENQTKDITEFSQILKYSLFSFSMLFVPLTFI